MTHGPKSRRAAIDIGTNCVLLTIVEVSTEGEHGASDEPSSDHVLLERSAVTRLGQGVDQSKRLHPDAQARTLGCLRDYAQLLLENNVTEVRAVGTSALRDVVGGENFLTAAREILPCQVEVISGMREAELTFRGALSGLPKPNSDDPCFVFDIGGGSTELILGDARSDNVQRSVSLNLGSVRLTERLGLTAPLSHSSLTLLRECITAELQTHAWLPRTSDLAKDPVGVAGTVTTLYAIAHKMAVYEPKLVHGRVLWLKEISELVRMLCARSQFEKEQLPGLSPARADVIVAGAVLCEEILKARGADKLQVSDRGVRFGLLSEMSHRAQNP